MIGTILVAVNDSSAAFRAATQATRLCVALGARLVAVGVVADHARAERLTSASGLPDPQAREATAIAAVLRHLRSAALGVGVDTQTCCLSGRPAEQVLAEARRCSADLIVIGRADRHGAGMPYIGTDAQRILEFASVPVLVVPPPEP